MKLPEEDAIRQVVTTCAKPCSVPQIQKQCKSEGHHFSQEECYEILSRLAKQGDAIHEHPKRQRNHKYPQYWHRSQGDYVQEHLLTALELGEETLTKLRQSIPCSYRDLTAVAVSELVDRKQLHQYKVRNSVRLTIEPPSLAAVLTEGQKNQLQIIAERLRVTGRPHLTYEELIRRLTTEPEKKQTELRVTENLVREWYESDLPNRGGLLQMPIPLTWKRCEVWASKHGGAVQPSDLHHVLRSLSESGQVALIHHNNVSLLDTDEKDLLFINRDGSTIYYYEFIA